MQGQGDRGCLSPGGDLKGTQQTLTPSDKGVPWDRAPCSAGAVLPGCRCPARAPAVRQGLTSNPAPSSPTGEEGAGEETWARLLDEVSVPSLPCAKPPAAGLPAVG